VFKNTLCIFYWTVHISRNELKTWQCHLLTKVKLLNSETINCVKWLRLWTKTYLLHTFTSMGCLCMRLATYFNNRKHWCHRLCILCSPLHLKMMFRSRRWHNKGPWAVRAGFWSKSKLAFDGWCFHTLAT
jgi:hypothetical protein